MPTYPKRNTPVEEQETSVNFFRDEDRAHVYTSDRTTITKLDKLCEDHPDTCTVERMDEYSKWYWIPKKYVKFNAPPVRTESQREAARRNGVIARSVKLAAKENNPNSPQ